MAKSDNLKIWNAVEKTDPKFTKADNYSNQTTINGTYLMKKATELFGPIGVGWGYSILEERYDDGVPFVVKDVGPVMSKTHTIKLELWYMDGSKKGNVVNFGHTKYIYKTKNGYMIDDEAPKKSLTDAIKKCLSMLGFSGDIFMGQYEDREYLEEITRESQIAHADDKDAEIIRQEKEQADWVNKELEVYSLIDEVSALEKICNGHKRRCQRRGDREGFAKFEQAFSNRLKEIQGEK